MWAEVSSLSPHFLHSGLYSKPIRWRCLRRVLWPVRRPVTTLDWFVLKDKSLILVPWQGPEINSRAWLKVFARSCQLAQCCLLSQHLSLLLISHLETPKAGSGASNLRAESLLASLSAISLPVRRHVRPLQQNSTYSEAGYPDRLGPWGKSVEISKKLNCFLNYRLSDQVQYIVMVSRTTNQAWSKDLDVDMYCK
jgi:hypothetical protein